MIFVIASIFALNIWASIVCIRYDGSTRQQRILQLLMIWFLPVIGGIAVLSVLRPLDLGPRDDGPPLGEGTLPDE